MAVIMDESGVNAQNGRSCSNESLQSHFKTIAFRRGPFPHLQCSGDQVRYSLAKQHSLVGYCELCRESWPLYVGNMQAVITGNLVIEPNNTKRKAGAYESFTICAEGLAWTVPAK
ncbi:MAG: hypothetical protein PVJ86_13780 [Phycisphaerales bacterium]|jgi:hypothetical protein